MNLRFLGTVGFLLAFAGPVLAQQGAVEPNRTCLAGASGTSVAGQDGIAIRVRHGEYACRAVCSCRRTADLRSRRHCGIHRHVRHSSPAPVSAGTHPAPLRVYLNPDFAGGERSSFRTPTSTRFFSPAFVFGLARARAFRPRAPALSVEPAVHGPRLPNSWRRIAIGRAGAGRRERWRLRYTRGRDERGGRRGHAISTPTTARTCPRDHFRPVHTHIASPLRGLGIAWRQHGTHQAPRPALVQNAALQQPYFYTPTGAVATAQELGTHRSFLLQRTVRGMGRVVRANEVPVSRPGHR